ncbi:MAG: HTTM domain-containing protein [Williamsia sp.]|nr:HTTM domain-containing protein [Williamsia sp.]
MKKISTRARGFFTQQVPAQTLGAFRIATGFFALVQLFVLLPDWLPLYGPQGILPWEVSDALSIRSTPGLSFFAKGFAAAGLSSQSTVWIVTGIYFLSLTGLTAGYKTRIMAILAYLMHTALNTTGHFTAYGVEMFAHIALFYCIVLPVNISWSVDNWKKPVSVPPYLVTLSVRLIQLHLCIMYTASGLEKALGAQWWNGEAIWIAMQQDQFHSVNIDWMARTPIVPKLLCWGTLLIETIYPVGMLWSKTRKFWLLGILSMHAGIAIFLGLPLFGALMFLLNLTAFGESSFPGLFRINRKKRFAFKSTILHHKQKLEPAS